jgi:hypothetical protein
VIVPWYFWYWAEKWRKFFQKLDNQGGDEKTVPDTEND